MKKNLILASVYLLLSIYGNAQNGTVVRDFRSNIGIGAPIISHHGLYLNEISVKAVRDFKTRCKRVSNETWEKTKDGASKVWFTDNHLITTTFYDVHGKWKATMKEYNEELMPFSIRDRVKRVYYDFLIDQVYEVTTTQSNGMPTWLVHIKNKTAYKLIRICDDEMDVWMDGDLQ